MPTIDLGRRCHHVICVKVTNLQNIRFANWHFDQILVHILYDCCDRVLLSVDCLRGSGRTSRTSDGLRVLLNQPSCSAVVRKFFTQDVNGRVRLQSVF